MMDYDILIGIKQRDGIYYLVIWNVLDKMYATTGRCIIVYMSIPYIYCSQEKLVYIIMTISSI